MRTLPPLVLVIDDVDAIVEELLSFLHLQAIPAVGARTLAQAIAVLHRSPQIRIIACDVRLDRESGLDLMALIANDEALAARRHHVVFITGDPLCGEGLPQPARYSILTKPVAPRALIGLFRERLADANVE